MKNEYLNDEYVTSILLRDIENNKMSDELAKIFLEIQKRVLMKPNFAGYYGKIKDEMKSEGVHLFLTHWKKFKPFRVKNNYKVIDKNKYLVEDAKQKANIIYTNKCFKKYDMLEIHNRTYTVKECKKINDNKYQIILFNKLKSNVTVNDDVIYLKPKYKFDTKENLKGGFTFLTTFAFTGAKNKIKQFKNEEEQLKKIVEKYNDNIYLTLHSQNINADGFVKNNIEDLL